MHSKRRYKVCICSVILGQLESFRNYKGFCVIKLHEGQHFSDSSLHQMFESEKFRFFFLSTKNSLTCTLGARGFSCEVSGFGQVLKSDPREKLFFFSRLRLRPTKRSSPSHARKNLWYPEYLTCWGVKCEKKTSENRREAGAHNLCYGLLHLAPVLRISFENCA